MVKQQPLIRCLRPEMVKADSEDILKEMITKGSFSHILLMRLAEVEKETNYVPGTTTGFYGEQVTTATPATTLKTKIIW